jgi:RimJ/RimL family protein N-acetyltransferase
VIIEALDEDFAALLEGAAPRGLRLPDGPVEGPVVLTMLRDLANRIRPDFAPASWLLVEEGELAGLLSITALVAAGEVRIGYGVAETRRNRGVASRAVAAVVGWASAEPRLSVIHAETAVDHRPSQRVLVANGFTQVGRRTDEEDGALIVWRRDLRWPPAHN